MRKVIFSINITIDGYADHTAAIADDEPHEFFTNLLDDVDVILFWPEDLPIDGELLAKCKG